MTRLKIEQVVSPLWEEIKYDDKPFEKKIYLTCDLIKLIFSYVNEARFGPRIYNAIAEGSVIEKINKFLMNRYFLEPQNSFNSERHLLVLTEIDRATQSETSLHVIDTISGEQRFHLEGPAIEFHSWRPNYSEFIFRRWVKGLSHWSILDINQQETLLSEGGEYALVSSNGSYLIVVSCTYGYVRLFDLQKRKLLDEDSTTLSETNKRLVLNLILMDPAVPKIEISLLDVAEKIFKKKFFISVC